MADIHALLIGINGYPVKPLNGCIQDVDDVETYLRATYPPERGIKLNIKRLTDKADAQGKLIDTAPTRDEIINAFQFFVDAKGDDFCLIYYSGHGSFSPAPKEFWTETDGFNESFVCLDSRKPGGRDLMDKEMAFLIWKTFGDKPDVTVVVITDCCHSGTITKALLAEEDGVTERMMSSENIPHTLQEYYGFGRKVRDEDGYVLSHDNTRVTVKEQKHIHFAASQANQTSKERPLGGAVRGAFTYSMLQVLNSCGGRISYKELVDKTSLAVIYHSHDQLPGLDVNGVSDAKERTAEKNKYFLSHDQATPNSGYVVYFGPSGLWCINAGAINGVQKGDTVSIEGKFNTVVVRAYADHAVISEKMGLQRGQNYPATIIPGMWKPLAVSIAPEVTDDVRDLILQVCANDQVPLVSIEENGTHTIRPVDNRISISVSGSDQPLIEPEEITDVSEAELFVKNIATIARWENILRLENKSTTINTAHYKLTLSVAEEPGNDEGDNFKARDIKPFNDLFYKQKNGEWYLPAFKLSFENKTDSTLWFGCAYMLFDFSILGEYYKPVQVGAHGTAYLLYYSEKKKENTDILRVQIEEQLVNKGYDEITEYLKIFISLDVIKLDRLSQDGIERAEATKSIDVSVAKGDSKGPAEEDEAPMITRKDWTTQTIGLRIIKPSLEEELLVHTDTNLHGMTIKGHHALQAKVALGNSDTVTRSLEDGVPPHRAKRNSFLQPFNVSSHSISPQVKDVIELFDVVNPETVTPERPLVIVPAHADANEHIVPIGYDEETGLYYPLGHSTVDGSIFVETLPSESPSNDAITTKSLLGSIKIYLQKTVGKALGFEYKFPQLAMAWVGENGKVEYDPAEEEVRKAVTAANKIIIFIHGIIGDTEGMVKSIKIPLNENGVTIENSFDLVLAFDYENLSTKIERTAADLRDRLHAVGLTPGHGKDVTIVAHSMGGLVSRWFTEYLDGNKVISRLVMMGTPNNGTHWADVRDLADALLTYAINGAAFLKPWMFILSGLGKLSQGVQVTLKQMDATNGIYDNLNGGKDPGISYVIVGGNTKLIVPDFDSTAGLVVKLFKKIKKRGVYDALDALLFKRPNDIAVTVESITKIKGSDGWVIKPVVMEAACDHLSYFRDKLPL